MILPRDRNRLPAPQPATVQLRRSYGDCRYGQIHIRTAYPSGGGFDERTPVVCLHHAGGSGRFFAPMLLELASDRSVYAIDLPGHGCSDAPPSRFSVADLAGAVGDFLDGLRVRSADVFGYQLGALVAADLAIARAQQIRRVMLWGVPAQAAQQRVAALTQPGGREDGSDVADEWRRTVENRDAGVSVAALAEDFSDRLQAGASGARALAAIAAYPAAERLPLVKQQALLMRLQDEFWEDAPRVRASLPNGSLLEIPNYGRGFISTAPQLFAAAAREFLDR